MRSIYSIERRETQDNIVSDVTLATQFTGISDIYCVSPNTAGINKTITTKIKDMLTKYLRL